MRPTQRSLLAPSLLALTLALGAASCGGGSSDPAELTASGKTALGSSDWAGAQADFEAALAAIGDDSSHPSFVSASIGAVEAKLHSDPEGAKDDFLALAERTTLKDKDFSYVGSKFANASQYAEAAYILDAGMKQHPESPALETLKQSILKVAENDSGVASVMASLGYL